MVSEGCNTTMAFFGRTRFARSDVTGALHQILVIDAVKLGEREQYRPVEDQDYLPDDSVGAMMGPDAIRKAMQWAMDTGAALFHVHMHGGSGVPGFSSVDIRENAKFVPDFFKVTPHMAHGAVVLSGNAARGQIWLERKAQPLTISSYSEIGMPIHSWSAT